MRGPQLPRLELAIAVALESGQAQGKICTRESRYPRVVDLGLVLLLLERPIRKTFTAGS